MPGNRASLAVYAGTTFADPTLAGRLAGVTVPALVIWGENDGHFSPDHGREISDQIAGSRCSVIPGAGHLSSLDSSDQFNRLLLGFLAAHCNDGIL